MFCPTCGMKNDEQSKFCGNCGSNLVNDKQLEPTIEATNEPLSESSFDSVPAKTLDQSEHPQYGEDSHIQEDPPAMKSNITRPQPHQNDRFIDTGISKKKKEPEVNSPWYYFAALLWPIGILVYLSDTSDKPVIAEQMREIMMFSGALTIFLFWLIG